MPGRPIEESVKQKIIEIYIGGCISPHGITATLNQQGCRVSYGSVWRYLNEYKLGLEEKHSAVSDSNSNKVQLQLEAIPRKEQSTESVSPNLINQSSPEASIVGAATSTSQLSKVPESITSANLIEEQQSGQGQGSPLSYFLKKSTLITPQNATTTPLSHSIDRSTLPPAEEFESESWNFQKSKAMAPTAATAAKQEMCEGNSLVAADDEHEIETDNDFDEQQQQRDWDEAWKTRILKTVLEDRKQRQLDLSLLEQKKQELGQQKRLIDQVQRELEARENKLIEFEPLIPSVKQLLDMGVTFNLILPYIETISEKAVSENIDFLKAAYSLTQELRDYRQLGSMNRAIEVAKQQLATLDMYALNRQNALTTLTNLQNVGITEKEIVELVGIVNRWNRQHPGLYHQGNGDTLDDNFVIRSEQI